jgi:flagellar hook-length control protein FliK
VSELVTAPATANPALASLALAASPATAAGSVTPRPDATTSAPGTAPDAGFSALLLGLRAGAGVAPAAATQAATAPQLPDAALPGGEIPTPDTLPPPLPGLPGALPAAAAPGPVDGADLPADGTELPPADVATLLAALEAPGATSARASPVAPTAMPPTQSPAVPPPTITNTSGQALPATRTRALPAGQATAGPAADADGTAPASAAEAAADDPVLPLDATRADATTATAERAAEQTASADFRTRLAMMLAPLERAPSADGSPTATTLGAFAAPVTATTTAPTLSAAAPDTMLDALPVLEPLGDADAFSQGIGERLLLLADRGLQSATIKLQPEHLGPMEIRIRVDDDGAAHVNFSAQHAQTRDALESAIPRLRELFADQGLSLSQANVDAGRGGFAQRAFAEPPPWLQWARGGTVAAEPEAEVSAWRMTRGPERRLDVLV